MNTVDWRWMVDSSLSWLSRNAFACLVRVGWLPVMDCVQCVANSVLYGLQCRFAHGSAEVECVEVLRNF